jgi:hypothetical protein
VINSLENKSFHKQADQLNEIMVKLAQPTTPTKTYQEYIEEYAKLIKEEHKAFYDGNDSTKQNKQLATNVFNKAIKNLPDQYQKDAFRAQAQAIRDFYLYNPAISYQKNDGLKSKGLLDNQAIELLRRAGIGDSKGDLSETVKNLRDFENKVKNFYIILKAMDPKSKKASGFYPYIEPDKMVIILNPFIEVLRQSAMKKFSIKVPNLIGKDTFTADAMIPKNKIEITKAPNNSYPVNVIFNQDPIPDTMVAKDSTINVFVSTGNTT